MCVELLEFINDALMAIFFFSIGLEIKREILVGELSSFRQALLPIVAAIGGMAVPVAIFSWLRIVRELSLSSSSLLKCAMAARIFCTWIFMAHNKAETGRYA